MFELELMQHSDDKLLEVVWDVDVSCTVVMAASPVTRMLFRPALWPN